ncbi:MAG: hypothetical protein NT163_00155 [Chlorobiales bacterium]|jgi:hypothetical protein|nr:hypothetical protein [Chlorobiales bacterium]
MKLYNYDTQETESLAILYLSATKGLSYLPPELPELKGLYQSRIESGDSVLGALLFVLSALLTDTSIELYNYDTQETVRIEIFDLTESTAISFIPHKYPELRELYQSRIDSGNTVVEALCYVFSEFSQKNSDE